MLGDKQYWEKNKTKQKKTPHTFEQLAEFAPTVPSINQKEFSIDFSIKK